MKKLFKKAAEPFTAGFWMLQLYILRAIPPFLGLISKISMNANRSKKIWLMTLFRAAWLMPRALIQHLGNIMKKRVVIARMSIGVTSRCTLYCDKCVSHVPDYVHPMHMPREELLADMRFLLFCVDYIYDINLSGGEAFLHPHLDELIRFLAESGKVGDVNITTNGTVIPGEKVLAALRDEKITVKISKYDPSLQPNVEQLKAILKEQGIPYIHDAGTFWNDAGDLSLPLPGSAKRRFRVCAQQLCTPYWNGKLHMCTESTYFQYKHPEKSVGDYVDLQTVSPEEFREQFRAMYKKRVISACEYCAGFTYKTPKIPLAVQRERPAKEDKSDES